MTKLLVLAARLRVTLDRRLGRHTPAQVIALAKHGRRDEPGMRPAPQRKGNSKSPTTKPR